MSEKTPQELAIAANAENDNSKLKAEIERLTSTNERLLVDSKSNKTKRDELDSLKSQIESFKNEKLEATGNWQERLEGEQEKNRKLNDALIAKDNMILKGNIVNAVSKSAKDAWDVNDLLAQSEFAKMIEVNEETLQPIQESVDNFVNSLKEQKKYLFKGGKVAPMADAKPGVNAPKDKTIKQMSNEERLAAMQSSFQALV